MVGMTVPPPALPHTKTAPASCHGSRGVVFAAGNLSGASGLLMLWKSARKKLLSYIVISPSLFSHPTNLREHSFIYLASCRCSDRNNGKPSARPHIYFIRKKGITFFYKQIIFQCRYCSLIYFTFSWIQTFILKPKSIYEFLQYI